MAILQETPIKGPVSECCGEMAERHYKSEKLRGISLIRLEWFHLILEKLSSAGEIVLEHFGCGRMSFKC